jgi:tetratricopeptide (TPR) repeat protein
MAKVSVNLLLSQAEQQFSLGKYENALTTYGLLLKENPTNSAAKIGAYLCDIGMENEEEAQALFDYYQIIKRESTDAEEVMTNLISTLDMTKGELSELLNPLEERIEYEDGIRYTDFLSFVDERTDFARAFEDVMFSTRVILKGKEEYIAFISELIEREQYKFAEEFLDSMSSAFGKDQDIYALYHKLKENREK